MRFRVLPIALALSTLGTAVAHADTFVFSFGASGDTITGSGVLTATLISPGEYTATSIEGTTSYLGGAALNIAGLLPAGSYQNNDNLLSLTNGAYTFDFNGLSYELSDQTVVNLYTDPGLGTGESFQTSNYTIGSEYSSYAVAPTPEPGSFVLLGTGLLGVAGVVRKRFSPLK